MDKERPIGVISLNDITALTHILYFYERWLLSTLAPSAKRSRNVSEVQFLTVKLSLLGSSKATALTHNDVEHIKYAIGTFISQVRRKMPQSQSRDDVIESSEGLLGHIMTIFATEQA